MGDIFFSSTLPTGRPPYSPGTQKEQTIQIDAPQIRRTPKDCFKKKKSMTLATQNPVLCICVCVCSLFPCHTVIFVLSHCMPISELSVNYPSWGRQGGAGGERKEKRRSQGGKLPKTYYHKHQACRKWKQCNM